MSKPLAFLAAIILTFISIGSTALAAEFGRLSFTLFEDSNQRLQLDLRHDRPGGTSNSSFQPRDLSGLDRAALRSGAGPLGFALVREPGRIDCIGQTQRSRIAAGECRFTENPSFAALLSARGVDRPTSADMLGLTMVGATRALVDALAAAGYRPDISDLTGLAALDVTPGYIAELERLKVKPARAGDLIAFKALDISPAYVSGIAREGYPNLRPGDLTAMKAMGITPDFIRAFRAAGYDKLPVSTLIRAKAMGVTPDLVRSFRRPAEAGMAFDDLIRIKAVGLLP